MGIEKLKILLIVSPARTDFYKYLEGIPNASFYVLFYVKREDVDGIELPSFIQGQYFWSDYNSPEALLKKINPSKIIFFEIIDQRQISLIVTANHLKYATYYLEHGAAGDKETAKQRSESGKLKHLIYNRIPNVIFKLTSAYKDAILVKKFYFSSAKYLSGQAKKRFLRLPFMTLFYKPNKALMACKFQDRVPQKCILFNKMNFEEFALYTGIREDCAVMEGVPFFDNYYRDVYENSGPIVYIEHPLLEEEICGWTKEHHKMVANKLKHFSNRAKEKVIIKLHPRSSKELWNSYNLESENFEIVQDGDFTDFYLKSKLILAYASSLVNGFLCAKKNVVLLGWHPEPHVFGADFSKTGLCHLSLNIEDLEQKYKYWIDHNLSIDNTDKYISFINAFNNPFDGKATQRVIQTILHHEIS